MSVGEHVVLLGVTVRRANLCDWGEIWPFWRHIVQSGETHPYPTNADEATAKKLWLEPERSVIYVAEHKHGSNAHIAAAMMTKPLRYGNGDHTANFDLMVRPECRGRSVGRALAQRVIAECARPESGYTAMEAYSVVSVNAPAVRLWCSLGFQIMGTIPNAFRHPIHGLVDVYQMHMTLKETS